GGLPARLAGPGAPFEQLGQTGTLGGHLIGDLQDGALDVREVLVEGRGRSARLPGDIDDLDVPVRGGAEHLAEAVEQLLLGGVPTPAGHRAVDGTDLSCHAVSLPRGDRSAIRPTANGVHGCSEGGVAGLRGAPGAVTLTAWPKTGHRCTERASPAGWTPGFPT